jgi:hypothetical protein
MLQPVEIAAGGVEYAADAVQREERGQRLADDRGLVEFRSGARNRGLAPPEVRLEDLRKDPRTPPCRGPAPRCRKEPREPSGESVAAGNGHLGKLGAAQPLRHASTAD